MHHLFVGLGFGDSLWFELLECLWTLGGADDGGLRFVYGCRVSSFFFFVRVFSDKL